MRVQWTVQALSQLNNIQGYIAENNSLAAFQIVEKIRGKVGVQLAQHPYSGREALDFPNTRILVVSGTSFVVIYRVRDVIEILQVRHSSQRWPPVE